MEWALRWAELIANGCGQLNRSEMQINENRHDKGLSNHYRIGWATMKWALRWAEVVAKWLTQTTDQKCRTMRPETIT